MAEFEGFEVSEVSIEPVWSDDDGEEGLVLEVSLTAAGDRATILRALQRVSLALGTNVHITSIPKE